MPETAPTLAVLRAYRCEDCGADGVRLWRSYASFTISLLCRACAEKEQCCTLHGDQVGWRVPAVMDEDGTFWGYTSVPPSAVAGWLARPEDPTDA